jgi:hypothetical protein
LSPTANLIAHLDVGLIAGPCIKEFLDEAEPWPNSRHLDQIDAASTAFSHLTMNPGLDYSKAHEAAVRQHGLSGLIFSGWWAVTVVGVSIFSHPAAPSTRR